MRKMFPVLFLIAIVMLAGCGESTVVVPPTHTAVATVSGGLPTPVPTLVATSSISAPIVSPVAPTTPPSAFILPAPLYVIDAGQIARIERHGMSRTLVTHETVEMQGINPVATFAVSRQSNLAFVVGDIKADRLMVSGPYGEDPRIIYEEEGHELSHLVWSPDGTQIYFQLLNNRQPADIPSGLYHIAATGGEIALLRANDALDSSANPAPTVSGYRPFAPSPDSSRMLIEVYSLHYDTCSLAVMPLPKGEIVRLSTPADVQTYCGDAVWSPDGTAVYFLAGSSAGPSIWRADATSGVTTVLTDSSILARAPFIMSDGTLRFILVTPAPDDPNQRQFALAELGIGQTTPTTIGPPFSDRLGLVIWSPNGDGAVAIVGPADRTVDLYWLPLNAAPVILPNTNDSLSGIAWGAQE